MKVKNPWRNAACLLLLTGPFRYSRPAQRLSKPLAVGYSPYLEYKCSGTPQPEVLFVKRHPQVNFMVSKLGYHVDMVAIEELRANDVTSVHFSKIKIFSPRLL